MRYQVPVWILIGLLYVSGNIIFRIFNHQGWPDIPSIIFLFLPWLVWIVLAPRVIQFSLGYLLQPPLLAQKISYHVLHAVGTLIVFFSLESFANYCIRYAIHLPIGISEIFTTLFPEGFGTRLVVYSAIVVLAQGIAYVEYTQQVNFQNLALQSQVIISQLKALKMQVQPHFLFNTHQAIVGMLLDKENDKAIAMLTNLSSLLRQTLDIAEEQFISLSHELDITRQYLSIQQIRFSDRLKINIDAQQDLLDAQLPPFILQPLVENAFQHGFSKNAHNCLIEVIVRQEADRVRINIRDDGAGIPVKPNFKVGIGLSNVYSRLSHVYQDDFHLRLKNNQSRGTDVELDIPLIRA
ncbi:MAG: histidine kinase [Bacteroidetes bacterium]|nr:histidine kinase [Bacteroidota bacterium]